MKEAVSEVTMWVCVGMFVSVYICVCEDVCSTPACESTLTSTSREKAFF